MGFSISHVRPALWAIVVVVAGGAAGSGAEPRSTEVFASGHDGYHTYRIPAVVVTPSGTVLAFCEGRKTSRNDHGDIDLVLKRSADGGNTWSSLQLVHEEGGEAEITIGNPCPVIDQASGTIWLPFTRNNDRVFVTSSGDDGRTWSPPVEITSEVKRPGWGWYATGPGIGIQLKDGPKPGRLVIPCDHREVVEGNDTMFSHVFYSDDFGKSWTLGGVADRHTDECQLAELADGRLMLNMRNYWGRTGKVAERGGMRAVAYSRDAGESWSELEFHDTLVEPICQASLLRYVPSEGGPVRLLFSNPASKTARQQLTVRSSEDEGRTWPIAKVLHSGPAAYSCLCAFRNGTIGCLYEAGDESAYERIVFSRFPLNWLAAESNSE